MKRSLVAILLALAGTASAQLTAAERKGVADALYIGNMTLRDLEFERKPFNDKYRLALVNTAIDRPLEGSDKLMQLHQSGNAKSLAQLIKAARTQGLGDPARLTIINAPHKADPEIAKLHPLLQKPVKTIVDAVNDANSIIRNATSRLTPADIRYLVEALPMYANEEPSIKFGYSTRTSYDAKKVLELVDRIDLPAIRAAAETLATAVESTRNDLGRAKAQIVQALDLKLRISGLRVDIAGVQNNVHEGKDAIITIDLGGKDIYRGRHGAGVGYASVLIDLADDDLFEVSDLTLGAGVVGIGLVYDIGGHDIFRCRSIALGAGLAGVGGFYREGGKDSYEAISLGQGYGQFGIGILLDTAGDDRYDGNFHVQGAARTGGVGWSVDLAGEDVYRAGGLVLNSPLFEKVNYSNGQGFASGYRLDTGGTSGGIGLITDFQGHDTYLGETYCQAASYWFGIGSLYDKEGYDTYTAYHYAQSSAMHMTAAYMFDLAGDDAYMVKLGACHAIGHDYGVAFLLDRAGMDLYASHDSRPATGNANGLGMLIEADGDDRYFGLPAAGNAGRGSGSLAVFADLAGTDTYGGPLGDSQATSHENWGVALDDPSASRTTSIAPSTPQVGERPEPGSLPMPNDAEMAQIYRKATQWAVGTATKEVADNVARLIGIGKPALQWMIDKRLATATRLEIRGFVAVINGMGADGRQLIAPKVASDNLEEARIALQVSMDAGVKEASPHIGAALQKPPLQRIAARAAGALGSREAIPDLLPLTASSDRLAALAATTALVSLAEPSTLSTAEALLNTEDLPIRKAAMALIAKFPDRALAIGRRLLSSADERQARIGIELLSGNGSPEALTDIATQLRSSVPGIRIQALLALDKRVPAEFRPLVVDLKKDQDSRVRAVAARIDLGR